MDLLQKPAAKKQVAVGRSKFGAFLAKMKQQKMTDGEKEQATVGGKEECVVVGTGQSARKGNDIVLGKVEESTDKAGENGAVVGTERDKAGENGAVVGTESGAAEKMAEEKMKTFNGGFFSVSSPVVSPSSLHKGTSVQVYV